MSNKVIYTVGGTVQAGGGVYISRDADEELLRLCRAGEFCFVLTARQMGKSSLMVATRERLAAEGIRSAEIDLTKMGTELSGLTAEQWYLGLIEIIVDQLDLDVDHIVWWDERAHLGPTQRLSQFLRQVVLEKVSVPVVIFIDEIDCTLNLDFTDDFFAAIRACYNARGSDRAFKRLSFVLLGVATSGDLISDPQRTPFNIGRGMDLTDFTEQQAIPLADGLDLPPREANQVLTWILDWTGGHPYLTQRLCAAAAASSPTKSWDTAAVDKLVEETFFGEQSAQDSNLRFVRDMLTQRAPDKAAVLKTYRRIHAGKAVSDEERSLIKTHLKLSGIVKARDGYLGIRNEIYRRVFDLAWIRENTAVNWARIVASIAVFVALLAVGSILYNAWVGIQVQDCVANFYQQAHVPEEQLANLARIFRLRGLFGPTDYDYKARELFYYGLSREEQLALFNAPGVEEADLIVVIRGLYETLADVDGTDTTGPLLKAMAEALDRLEGTEEAGTLRTEIDSWQEGRRLVRESLYDEALEAYNNAIALNSENLATLYERARIQVELSQYEQALSDLDRVMGIAQKASGGTTPTPPLTTSTPSADTPLIQILAPGADASPIHTPLPDTLPPTPTFSSGFTETPTPAATPEPVSIISEFATLGQISRAVRDLIYANPGLANALARASSSDYANLRVFGLVPTLTPTFDYGIQAHFIDQDHVPIINAVKDLGFHWVKQQIRWADFEPSKGQIEWGEMDRLVNSCTTAGIRILFSVVTAPEWARPGNTDFNVIGPPADPQDMADFVGALAERYKGRVQAYEIWNEQNLHYEWGSAPPDASHYVQLLAACYRAIKAKDPAAIVVSGAPTPCGDNPPYATDDLAYLKQMYQAGLKDYCDAVGVHPSGYNVPPDADWQTWNDPGASFRGPADNHHHSWAFRGTMEGSRSIMVNYGDASKTLWPTEFGWATTEGMGVGATPGYEYAADNTEAEQAQYIVSAYQMAKNWGWVGPMFLWNLNFWPIAGASSETAKFSIVRGDWTGRPAYEALHDMSNPPTSLSPTAQEPNLLGNPGFEEGFSERGAGEVTVANGWEAWWVQGSEEQTSQGYLKRPEYKPEDAWIFTMRRVHSGRFSQKYFNSYATHIAGIYQQVAVAKGSVVTFSIWVQVWSSTEPNPDQCEGFGNYAVSAGIDPHGGNDGNSGNIVWSDSVMSCNQWVNLSVSTVAQADRVTVFTRGAPEFRVQFNDSYWDDAVLTSRVTIEEFAATPAPTPAASPTLTSTSITTRTPGPPNTSLISDLQITNLSPLVGERVKATFSVRNYGGETFTARYFGVKGQGPDDSIQDFLMIDDFSLAPGAEYTYSEYRSFPAPGRYWFTPHYSSDGLNWRDITWPDGRTSYVYINVIPDYPPMVQMSVEPSMIYKGADFVIKVTANDDVGLQSVRWWSEGTGDESLNQGGEFVYDGGVGSFDKSWSRTWTGNKGKFTIYAQARDTAGQLSSIASTVITVLPTDKFSLSIGGEPFNNTSVQVAMGSAINWAVLQEEIGEVVLVDFGSGETLAGPTEPAYDPELAQVLLEEAGYGGFDAVLLYGSSDEPATELAEALVNYLNAVNISAELRGVSPVNARANFADMIAADESGLLIERRQ